MDKTIFVRTSKGEDEMRNKTALLSVDVKRALLMVDGVSSIREISKRVAPSLRNSLGQILKVLLSNGYIEKKISLAPPSQIIPPVKTVAPVKMTMPTKISIPAQKAVDDGLAELDFATEFNSQAEEMLGIEQQNLEISAQARTEDEEKFRAEIKARVEAEFGDEIKARVEAELRAEALAREEAENKKRMLDEAKAIEEARALAEVRARVEAKAQAEAKARAEAEAVAAAKLRVEAERRAEELAREEAATKKRIQEEVRAIAEAKAKQEAETKARADALAKEKAHAEAKAIAEEKARIEAEIRAQARARAEEETKKRMLEEAQALAEAQAKHEAAAKALVAAKARAEAEVKAIAEAKARAEAEVKAITEAKVRVEAEIRAEAKARIEAEIRAEAKARIEAEINARKELEQAGLKARFAAESSQQQKDQLAVEVREKLMRLANDEDIRKKDRQSGDLLFQSNQGADQDGVLNEATKVKPGVYPIDRSTSATVLFFDMVGYTKLSVNKQMEVKGQFNRLVSDCLLAQGDGERLILDTGDGAAIGFMQHPEDALQVAMQFRKVLIANQHNDYPELKVRIGIHMGPVNVVKDMNGQSNMVGDGINDAQRVMNFAGTDQIFVSRAYYDFISRLSDAYADIFYYQGTQKDKHEREHHVYKLVDVASHTSDNDQSNTNGAGATIKLEPFSFDEDNEELLLVKSVSKTELEKLENVTQQLVPPTNNKDVVVSKETTKPAVARFLRSEEEVKNLENEQAKLWAEAEQNAIETATKSTLRIVQPQNEKSHIVKHVHNARVKRERMPWAKMVAGLFLVLLVTLFVAPYVFPMRGFVPKIEQLLSEKFQQPVHIGGLSGRLLPTPRLDLIDVSIGEANQIKAQHARVNFSVLKLLSDSKSINSLELERAQIDGASLQEVSAWLQKAAADSEYPIAHILLNDGKLEANGIQLYAIGGELNFNNIGDFSTAKLYANGHKLSLDMDASTGDKTKVSISARSSALPLLPNWVFDDFNAIGELTNSALVISDVDSHISAGILHGTARLDWHSGWSAEGSLSAKAISAQNISGTVTGEAEGTARFQMRAADLAKLTDNATMDGSLVMNQGVINGIDIVETATRRRTENLPGGRTHFDELWSDFSFANGAYTFRQLKIKAGAVTAKGTLDINKQLLSGRMTVDLALRTDSMGLVPLQIGGSIDNPTLWMVR